jgi:FemAB-related protein (PEP-CTERM system-associated)
MCVQAKVLMADDSQRDAWDEFVRSRPDASFYHLYEWRGFFESVFSKETYYFAAVDEAGDIRGVLPLVRQRSIVFGDYMVSLPFLNYGGVLADSDEVQCLLVDSAISIGQSLGVSHTEFRDQRPIAGLSCREDKVAMILDLPESEEELARALGSKRRSQINRCKREGPVVRNGQLNLLGDFYSVFSRNYRDLGIPVYPKRMFVDILERFPDQTEILVVYVSGNPAAAAFLLHHGDNSEIPWAASVRKYNSIGINMLLYWEVFRNAIARGSHRFKKQWGAEPKQLYWNYWLREGSQMPQLTADSRRYALAIKTWRRLPLAVANGLGPYLVRNLP